MTPPPIPSSFDRYVAEALREIREANAPKLFAIAERIRVAIQQSEAK